MCVRRDTGFYAIRHARYLIWKETGAHELLAGRVFASCLYHLLLPVFEYRMSFILISFPLSVFFSVSLSKYRMSFDLNLERLTDYLSS